MRVRRVWPFLVVAPLALLLTDLIPLCAFLGMRWHASDDASEKALGLALLGGRLVDPVDLDQPWRTCGMGSGTHMLSTQSSRPPGRPGSLPIPICGDV